MSSSTISTADHPSDASVAAAASRVRAGATANVARLAIVAVGLVATVAVAAGAWTAHLVHEHAADGARDRARIVRDLVDVTLRESIASGDLEGTRAACARIAADHDLRRLVLVLPDGGVIVDVGGETPPIDELPEEWKRRPLESATLSSGADFVRLVQSSFVPGRGSIDVELELTTADAMTAGVDAALLPGALAGVAIGLLAWIGTLGVRRVRALDAVRGALLATANDSDLRAETHRVCPRFGAESEAWNGLLRRVESAREADVRTELGEALSIDGSRRRTITEAVDALGSGVLVLDDALATIAANPAAQRLLACGEHPALLEFVPEDQVEVLRRLVRVGGPSHAQIELVLESDDAESILRLDARRVPGSDPAQIVVAVEDVTQRRAADQSRDIFLAQATHELRTPLTNIRLYAESMLDDGDDDPALRSRAINVINTESRRLERVVGDLLSVSEMESGAYELRRDEVRTEVVFHELEEDFRPQAQEHGIQLDFDLAPKMPVISGERDKIVLALHNLVGNALKYTPDGGRVRVEVDVREDLLVVDVVDSGIGIPEDALPRIFDRFYRVSDERVDSITGSGLGLALAREVVRLHGGDITAESTAGEGSRFTMTVPLGSSMREAA